MFSNNLGRVIELYWLATRIVNYLRAEVDFGAVKNLAKGKIITRISADLIFLLVES